jgi:hypothetical protein
MPDIGQLLPVDFGRKTRLRPFFFKSELRCSEQKCVARQMRNEFAALPSSSLFPTGIKHGLIEPGPHQRERYESISVTNRVF